MADEASSPKASDKTQKRPGCLRRLLRGCGILLLVVVALLLVAYGYEVYRCSRFTPTGDALFDRYARAVIKRQAWKLFMQKGTHPATLPDELLAAWESEFGNDPRYWQLWYFNRYYTTRFEVDESKSYSEWRRLRGPGTYVTAPLETAIDQGKADATTLLFYYMAGITPWTSEESALSSEQALALVDDAIAADPDNAWGYYYRAMHLLVVEDPAVADMESVLADIRLGNAAPDDTPPSVFPRSAVVERMSQTSEPAGNAVMTGSVLIATFRMEHEQSIRIRSAFRRALELARESGNDALVQEMLVFACRYGGAEKRDLIDELVFCVLAGQIAEYIGTNILPEVNRDKRQDVYELCRLLLSMSVTVSTAVWKEQADRLERFWPYIQLGKAARAICGSGPREFYDVPYHLEYTLATDQWITRHARGSKTYARKLDTILSFDFDTMSFPDDEADSSETAVEGEEAEAPAAADGS